MLKDKPELYFPLKSPTRQWHFTRSNFLSLWLCVPSGKLRRRPVAWIEHALTELLSWRFGDWHKHYTGYTSWRKTWTKEQFQRLPAEYPEPLP